MAPSAVMDDDNLLLLSLLAGCHFRVIASILLLIKMKQRVHEISCIMK
jgi:hypothetical protein